MTTDTGAEAPEFLTVPEVAARLRVDPATVRRWIKAGDVPAVKMGRDYRVVAADLERMIGTRRTTALSLTTTNGGKTLTA